MHRLTAAGSAASLHNPTRETRGVVRAAATHIDRLLGIRTERARHGHRTICEMRTDDALWGDGVLDPLFEGAERIERRRSRPTAAVRHARHHEQANETLSGFAVVLPRPAA